jgi:hypothetical protein
MEKHFRFDYCFKLCYFHAIPNAFYRSLPVASQPTPFARLLARISFPRNDKENGKSTIKNRLYLRLNRASEEK